MKKYDASSFGKLRIFFTDAEFRQTLSHHVSLDIVRGCPIYFCILLIPNRKSILRFFSRLGSLIVRVLREICILLTIYLSPVDFLFLACIIAERIAAL
jgi:hypothetical protein